MWHRRGGRAASGSLGPAAGPRKDGMPPHPTRQPRHQVPGRERRARHPGHRPQGREFYPYPGESSQQLPRNGHRPSTGREFYPSRPPVDRITPGEHPGAHRQAAAAGRTYHPAPGKTCQHCPARSAQPARPHHTQQARNQNLANKRCAPRTSRIAPSPRTAMRSRPGNTPTGRQPKGDIPPRAHASSQHSSGRQPKGDIPPRAPAACRPTQTAPATRMHRQAPNQTAPAGAQPNCTGWADCPTNNLTLNIV